jgi:hypothetical protein
MTDIYADELYNPSFQISSELSTSTPAPLFMPGPQNDVFSQRLWAANSQYINASNTRVPLTIPSRKGSVGEQLRSSVSHSEVCNSNAMARIAEGEEGCQDTSKDFAAGMGIPRAEDTEDNLSKGC